MKLVHYLCASALLLASQAARADIACELTSSPAPIKVIFTGPLVGGRAQGTMRLQCTRDPNGPAGANPQTTTLWIGMAQPANGVNVPGDHGGTINYDLYHSTTTSGMWRDTDNGVPPGSTTNGAVRDTGVNFGNGGAVVVRNYAFTLNVAPAWPIPRAGVYAHSLPYEVRLQNRNGTLVGSGTIEVLISVPNTCRFSTAPSPVDVTYPAFTASDIVGHSDFGLTCTQGTNYRVTLDAPGGVVPGVELAYTATLNTGTAAIPGSAVEQPYRVTITFPAGQAGRCNAASCQGTDSRTITVSY